MTNLSERSSNPRLAHVAIVAILALLSTASTCADINTEPPEANCVVDAECKGAQAICFQGACAPTCVIDDDCDDAVCRSEVRAAQDDVVDVCVAEIDANNMGGDCRFDRDCDAASPGSEARCGIDGTCFIPAFSLLIRDTTIGDDAADGGPGADIAAIYLQDPVTGAPVAWADTITYQPAVQLSGDFVPNGERVALNDERTCTVATYADVATPLGGEGGVLLVRFLEGVTGDTVSTPPSSWNVVVVEWGDNCPGGELGEPDSYDVYACAAPTHKATDPGRDCGELLARAPNGGRLAIDAAEK